MKKEVLLGDKCEDKNDPSATDNYSPLSLLVIKVCPFQVFLPLLSYFLMSAFRE